MLGTLPDDFKSKWPQHISTLVYAYNCTCSNATGFSPYYLLYGQHPLLPIDIEFGVFVPKLSEVVTYKYVQNLKKRLENAFQKANAFCEKEAVRSKQCFDRTAKCSKLLPVDLVLVKRKGFTSKHKIADKQYLNIVRVCLHFVQQKVHNDNYNSYTHNNHNNLYNIFNRSNFS